MAVICPRYEFLFIHIPRTGGTSIEQALRGHPSAHPLPVEIIEGRQCGLPNGLGEEKYHRYFKFTFVRNPWDHTVSIYHFYRSGSELYHRDRLPGVSFAEYVRRLHQRVKNWERSIEKRRGDGSLPRYPERKWEDGLQWPWFMDFDGNLLVDFIGRYENLAGDFQRVLGRISLQAELPHVNRANSRSGPDYRDHYDDETRALVADIAHREIELFGYEF